MQWRWRSQVEPTALTRQGARVIVGVILGTLAYLAWRYTSLPWLLPVHFQRNGLPDGWQYKTGGRVFLPVFVQTALAIALGSVAAVLLTRRERADPDAPDVKAAATAAEAVVLTAAIWTTFQAYAAVSLVGMWARERGGLGPPYTVLELVGLVLTAAVGVRAHVHLGRPAPLPYVAEHWRMGQLYKNPDHPALFVPTRDGSRWTLNFGRPGAALLLGGILIAGAAVPTIILILALRS